MSPQFLTIVKTFFRGEYFLIDYLQKLGNFNTNSISSMFQCEGYHDLLNMDIDKLSNNDTTLKHRKYQGTVKNGKRVYDFLFIPNNGFLNSNLPLVNNSELKISFDRAQLNMAFMAAENVTDMNQIVKLNDVLAITEYISSEELRKYFSKIDTSPLAYKFDEIEITNINLMIVDEVS